jgi:hypothetical protein
MSIPQGRTLVRIKEKTQDFKASVVPVESKVILPKIAGPGKKTRVKANKLEETKQKRCYCCQVKEK